MKQYAGSVPDDSDISYPPQPRFVDSTETAQQVVRLSPFRHLDWIRQRIGPARKYTPHLRLPALVIAFGIAGGATGGIVAAVSQHMKQDSEPSAATEAAESQASPQESVSLAATSNDNGNGRAREVPRLRASRRSFHRPNPGPRLLAVYDDFDFDLAPEKKRHGKKEDY